MNACTKLRFFYLEATLGCRRGLILVYGKFDEKVESFRKKVLFKDSYLVQVRRDGFNFIDNA